MVVAGNYLIFYLNNFIIINIAICIRSFLFKSILFFNMLFRDGADMLRDFLGRDPTIEPFLKEIGVSV